MPKQKNKRRPCQDRSADDTAYQLNLEWQRLGNKTKYLDLIVQGVYLQRCAVVMLVKRLKTMGHNDEWIRDRVPSISDEVLYASHPRLTSILTGKENG